MNKKLRVLLVDDDEDDFLLTSAYLKDLTNWDFQLQWCPTYEKAVHDLANCKHDLYIFDYLLGANTGIDLIEEAIRNNCQEPIILLTGKGDEKIALEALRLGAADYLIKSELGPTILERSLRYALERTQVIKALRQSERRYRRIFEESKDMLFISDLSGKIVDINAASVVLTGYSQEELLTKSVLDLMDGSDVLETWSIIEDELEIQGKEVVFFTKEGEKRFGVLSATIERDNTTTYAQGRLHDITSQKKTERERLFSEKLAVTSRLVQMLAHEVRNPLTNVNLSAEQLESELEDEGLIFYTDIIKRNCGRINDLITQLLQSSRKSEFSLGSGSLNQILDEILLSATDRLRLKRIQVKKSFTKEDTEIMLNEEMFKIAILNLVTNAIEAMEEGEGVLKVTTRRFEQDVQILVADNGTGISEKNMAQIFEPYFTGKKSGMGIGLASTLNIVQSHKGRIDVQSEIGVGTVFTLSFPMVEDTEVR